MAKKLNMFSLLWLKRFFLSRNKFIRFTPLVSVFSLIIATSSLILAMSVYSGYESTIKQSIIDMTGHLIVTGQKITPQEEYKITLPYKASYHPFLSSKGLLVSEGKLSGIFLEGVLADQQLKKRLITGSLNLKDPNSAVIGRGVAKRFNLKPGDSFHIVIPKTDTKGSFEKKYKNLYVEGVLDFGFHDFNERHILVNLQTVQKLIHYPGAISGMRIRMHNPSQTEKARLNLIKKLGPEYKIHDWKNIIKNTKEAYFQAVKREKFLIFFILMVLVIAGAFNVSSHLSISVLNQVRELSILKIMGASKSFIFFLLIAQGFLISLVGTLLGMSCGWLLSLSFVKIQSIWQLIPSDVYKINTIITDLRYSDILLILICSQMVCITSCLLPAWRALKLSPKKGLLYE